MFDASLVIEALQKQLSAAKAKLADREKRIRLVRDRLSFALGPMGFFEGDVDLNRLLDLRRPLPKRGRR